MTIKAQAPETPQFLMCPEVIYETIRPWKNLRIHYYLFLSVVLVLAKTKGAGDRRDLERLNGKKRGNLRSNGCDSEGDSQN